MLLQQKKIEEVTEYVPHIGDKIKFAPTAFLSASGYEQEIFKVASYRQEGVICYINRSHRYYRVVFYPQGKAQYECFKF